MKLVTAAQMKELDRRTIEEYGTPGEVLMDRAGQGVSDVVHRLAEASGFFNPFVCLFAGRGNNGGDAFAAACHLKRSGHSVEVFLAGAVNEVKGDAFKQLSRARTEGITIREMPTKEDWERAQDYPLGADLIVDGILGTGSKGPARGPAVGAIQYMNIQAADSLVISIDIPSGLDADTGCVEGEAVQADLTATIALPKQGLLEPAALNYVGAIEVIDIGIPLEYVEQTVSETGRELIYITDLRSLFPRRHRASHKGDYGHVLLLGGARGYSGAISRAARAALRSGAGLVTAVVPDSIAPIVAGASQETMVRAAPETDIGSLAPEAWDEWKERLDEFSAVLVGPGLTRHEKSATLVRNILKECTVPLVIDADAITVLKDQVRWIQRANSPVVLTPHPGELSALISKSVKDIQSDRCATAAQAAEETKATVVLKGAGTIVAGKGFPLGINMTGNPGMATGGMGDALAGLLTGLLGQGLDPYHAACAAVCIHGKAGDLAAWRRTQAGIVAGDVVEEIPYVFRDITVR